MSLQLFAGNSAISLGIYYFIYNNIASYLTFVTSFVFSFIFAHFLKLINYGEVRFHTNLNIIMILEFINENMIEDRSFINNNKELTYESKQNLLPSNTKIFRGNHILFIKNYGFINLNFKPSSITIAEDLYIFAPNRMLTHLYKIISTADFIKSVKAQNGYELINDTTGRTTNICNSPILKTTKLQETVINNIINFTLKVFPVLYKNKLPTIYSVLLHGPPGTGKTTICNLIANKLSAYLINFNIKRLDRMVEIIETYGKDNKSIKVIAINELDLYYKDSTLSNNITSFTENIHDILECSGPFIQNNFIIVIATTNDYNFIKEKDPATISRFRDIIEMPNLSINESINFAKEYTSTILGDRSYLLNDEIEKLDSMSIREITKYINLKATNIMVSDEIENNKKEKDD